MMYGMSSSSPISVRNSAMLMNEIWLMNCSCAPNPFARITNWRDRRNASVRGIASTPLQRLSQSADHVSAPTKTSLGALSPLKYHH